MLYVAPESKFLDRKCKKKEQNCENFLQIFNNIHCKSQ